MVATRPTRWFFSSRKEGRPRLHRASGSWKYGSYGDGVLCVVQSFNVQTSFSWSPQGVHGARPRAVPSCPALFTSDPLAKHGKTLLPVRQLPRRVPPRPDSGPMPPWQQTQLKHPLAHSTWLSRQQTIPLMRFGTVLIIVYLPVDFDAHDHA